MTIRPPRNKLKTPRHGVARVISKLGLGSRNQAAKWVAEGRVRVNGLLVSDAEYAVAPLLDRVTVDGLVSKATRMVVMLNKPRGLVTTARDEHGRDTVYRCFQGADLPWLAPVGRLDKASEGLLLFSNDPAWAARVTDPASKVMKTYHVQVKRVADSALPGALERGAPVDEEFLRVHAARWLRSGEKNAWLEIMLDEGRNRQIRRLLSAFDVPVLRLLRVSIGAIALGALPKGAWRELTSDEIDSLAVG